jgi:Ca2+-binding RTX toxin-like protein
VDVATGSIRSLLRTEFDDGSPAFAPDGATVAYVTERVRLLEDIAVVRADGRGRTMIVELSGEDENPDWQPGPPPSDACTIRGTPAGDDLRGTAGVDVICGYGGNDVLRGRAGDDRLLGGVGLDRLLGGAGNDLGIGGPGVDVCRTERQRDC